MTLHPPPFYRRGESRVWHIVVVVFRFCPLWHHHGAGHAWISATNIFFYFSWYWGPGTGPLLLKNTLEKRHGVDLSNATTIATLAHLYTEQWLLDVFWWHPEIFREIVDMT